MPLSLVALALVVACRPGPEQDTAVAPQAWVYDPPQSEASPPSLGEIATRAGGDLAGLLDTDADTVRGLLGVVLAESDAGCPALEDFNGQDLWSGGCTSPAGVSHEGWLLTLDARGQLQDDGRIASELFQLNGLLRSEWPDGTWASLSGDARGVDLQATEDTPRESTVSVAGTFRSTRPELEDTWVAQELAVNLQARATVQDGLNRLELEATLRAPDRALELRGFDLQEQAQGCTLSVEALRLWWPEHGWVQLSLPEGEQALDPCVACGEATWQDQDRGQVCVSLDDLLDWRSTPW